MVKETVKNKGTKNNLPLRINILFLVVFLAFAGLVLRLAYVQIVNGQHYKNALNANHYQTASIDSARGKIMDKNGVVLADNNAELAIVYIRNAGLNGYKSLDIAKKLSNLITMDNKAVQLVAQKDKQEYYVLTHYKNLQQAYDAFLTKNEQKNYSSNPAQEYNLLLSRVPGNLLSSFTAKDYQIMAIDHAFNQASNLNPYIVKRGLSVNSQEYVDVVDHLSEFNGTIQTADVSSRVYAKNKPFYIGNVGQIPADKINNYLAEGYSRNAMVGVSNLEEEYESYLRGIPMKLTYNTKKGVPVGSPTIKEGQRGDDLQLTIDSRLQNQLTKILQSNIKAARAIAGNGQNNSAYAVVMNPKTGAILAIGGQQFVNGKFIDASNEAINSQFEMGSAVKGATELTGYRYNAMPSSFYDMPIQYPDMSASGQHREFTSWEGQTGLGIQTPEQALAHSSNVFMAKIVSNMAGITLTPAGGHYNATLPAANSPRFMQAINNMRNGYNELGLGVKTGIDLPTEGTGYNGGMPAQSGLIHQFAIGQFDTYTPLEMVQYISAIANGGYRVQPHLLGSVHAPGTDPNTLGPTVYTFKTNVLNTINNSQHDIKRVQQGLYLVTHEAGATATLLGTGPNVKYKIAAKTGTAQIDPNNLNLYNETLVSYAPYDNPQIAVSVVVPKVEHGTQNQQIALDVYKYYDQLYHYTSGN
ncbi:penicillin-binding protein 2 [Sporolactobacillus shoreae]|uniref:Penicillin-binding protein 2 n=1 Tax=Sporolactobacillus shoreae TaxID=1465501 RepID=A0A4Z0GTL0_9BACL|nr:penicillin-binding protein 2 [Sporolactobacillus shoreae]TGA99606.1 penicillin-binding protein 2 [Sporolactobacillus shoreae]